MVDTISVVMVYKHEECRGEKGSKRERAIEISLVTLLPDGIIYICEVNVNSSSSGPYCMSSRPLTNFRLTPEMPSQKYMCACENQGEPLES